MASAYLYTPCKDRRYEKCGNYMIKCDECKHEHSYSVLSVKPYKDYFEKKKKSKNRTER